jgi:hypothetical protein
LAWLQAMPEIDDTLVIAAANICDESVATAQQHGESLHAVTERST